MVIRDSQPSDIEAIMECIADAQALLAELGVDQWQDGYPTDEIIRQDIARGESFVLEQGGRVVATAVISLAGEPTYSTLEGGCWLNDEAYVVIHRLAARADARGGVAKRFFAFAEALANEHNVLSIRVDTHTDNKIMLHLLSALNYTRCGTITLTSGAKRVAFQKVWQTTKI